MTGFWLVLAIAVPAALASPLAGLLALWKRPTTLLLSLAVGFAGGVLLGTFAFEMMPKALEQASLWFTLAGFAGGFALLYGLDLYVNRGKLAGEEAEQQARVKRFHIRYPPRGDEVTVLAGGTSAEELIEGASIGVGAAIDPSVGLVVAVAVMIDNVSEALSIGELVLEHDKSGRRSQRRRIIGWTSLMGASLLSSAILSWVLLRNIPQAALGTILATGAGGMFYLTATDLLPEAQKHHYEQSSAFAAGVGFLIIFTLTQFM